MRLSTFPRGRRARAGGIALTAALMVLPIGLLAGLGIDFGRQYLAQAQMSQAVDAGALAGARVLGLRDPTADARMYFDANLHAPNPQMTVSSFTVTPSGDNSTLKVTAQGTLNTTFLRLAGAKWETLPIGATATSRRTTLGMELALVLDVTGSMAGNGGMAALKPAALDLLSILFGSKTSLDTLFVSIVPFTQNVNFGYDRTNWLVGGTLDPALYAPFHWRGCVEARRNGEDQTDTPPSAAPFTPFLYPSTRAQTAAGAFGLKSDKVTPVYGDADWGLTPTIVSAEVADLDDTDTTDPTLAYTNANERKGPNVGCGQPMAGLTNDRAALERIIKALQPTNRGGTMGNLGMQAGWMTLSPRWRGLWGTSRWGTTTPAGLPLDYPTPRGFMQKVIVIMTDGENNWYDYARPPAYDYTGYGRLPEGRLGTTNGPAATTEINKRMSTMCERIKANGIKVYTITLGTNSASQTLYRNCATAPAYYFNAPSAADLRGAFREIGSQLANLRLER